MCVCDSSQLFWWWHDPFLCCEGDDHVVQGAELIWLAVSPHQQSDTPPPHPPPVSGERMWWGGWGWREEVLANGIWQYTLYLKDVTGSCLIHKMYQDVLWFKSAVISYFHLQTYTPCQWVACSHSPNNTCNHNINSFKMKISYMTITTISFGVRLVLPCVCVLRTAKRAEGPWGKIFTW